VDEKCELCGGELVYTPEDGFHRCLNCGAVLKMRVTQEDDKFKEMRFEILSPGSYDTSALTKL